MYVYTHTHTHTYIHTYIHTYMYTHTYQEVLSRLRLTPTNLDSSYLLHDLERSFVNHSTSVSSTPRDVRQESSSMAWSSSKTWGPSEAEAAEKLRSMAARAKVSTSLQALTSLKALLLNGSLHRETGKDLLEGMTHVSSSS
jgi:hypothetical protein